MSHFTVLVIGKNPEKQLAPFHQFECTGKNDEYVQDIDITQNQIEDYNKETSTMYVDQSGNKFYSYEDKFYRDPTEEEIKVIGVMAGSGFGNGLSYHSRDWNDGKGYRTKIHFMPEGFTEQDEPKAILLTFREFVADNGKDIIPFGEEPDIEGEHKYGYAIEDENGAIVKVINRTNPNYHWDWYSLGGRWTGYFELKEGADGETGRPGLMTAHAVGNVADSAIKKDIDFDKMRSDAAKKASEQYDTAMNIIGQLPVNIPWDIIGKEMGYSKEAREKYHGQERVKAWNNSKDKEQFGFFSSCDDFIIPKVDYVSNAINSAISTFAVIKDGKWYEKGSMGWWGAVHGEKDNQRWNEEFSTMIDNVSGNTLLSVYDCHI